MQLLFLFVCSFLLSHSSRAEWTKSQWIAAEDMLLLNDALKPSTFNDLCISTYDSMYRDNGAYKFIVLGCRNSICKSRDGSANPTTMCDKFHEYTVIFNGATKVVSTVTQTPEETIPTEFVILKETDRTFFAQQLQKIREIVPCSMFLLNSNNWTVANAPGTPYYEYYVDFSGTRVQQVPGQAYFGCFKYATVARYHVVLNIETGKTPVFQYLYKIKDMNF